jgi:hypothetical protein
LDRTIVAIAIVAIVFAIGYFGLQLANRFSATNRDVPAAPVPSETPTATRRPTETETPRPTTLPAATPRVDLPKPTPPAGGQLVSLSPALDEVGWIVSNERTGNHLGNSLIQAGVLNGVIYNGVLQFSLSSIPAGTKAVYATLELSGADDARLGGAGTWPIRMVRVPTGKLLSTLNFDDIRSLPWDYVLQPTLTRDQLGKGVVNSFNLTGPILAAIERQFGQGKVTFRVEGPTGNENNLFAWDSGFGADDLGFHPILQIGVLAPAALPPSASVAAPVVSMVVIPCVPTPASKAEQAALAATATAIATASGTPTAYPPNYVTPVIVTPAPPEQSIFAAATLVAQGAQLTTPTPTPLNWIVPFIVTNTPTPENQATSVYQQALATVMAATTGTPTPLPCHVWTATPVPPAPTPTATPVVIYPAGSATPSPAPTATPTAIPGILRGKILFMSDRDGVPAVYVMEPDGSHVGMLTNRWPFDASMFQQMIGANGAFRVFVQGNLTVGTKIAVASTTSVQPRVVFDNGSINYDPAFAPDGYNIAFVSIASGADEIYRINRDGGGFAQLTTGATWQWNNKPSWSPDGKNIVWWSNRETGRKQIWIMSADGRNLRNLSNNEFNDWDPVWVR